MQKAKTTDRTQEKRIIREEKKASKTVFKIKQCVQDHYHYCLVGMQITFALQLPPPGSFGKLEYRSTMGS